MTSNNKTRFNSQSVYYFESWDLLRENVEKILNLITKAFSQCFTPTIISINLGDIEAAGWKKYSVGRNINSQAHTNAITNIQYQ